MKEELAEESSSCVKHLCRGCMSQVVDQNQLKVHEPKSIIVRNPRSVSLLLLKRSETDRGFPTMEVHIHVHTKK